VALKGRDLTFDITDYLADFTFHLSTKRLLQGSLYIFEQEKFLDGITLDACTFLLDLKDGI
jgi:hypothetical protein